ncbi:MAG TPA: hypothetical protein VLG66_16275 [Alphaproteobacteria bacterium]|nr:hypothetical protein [Alphaproteobacteria bacterium]
MRDEIANVDERAHRGGEDTGDGQSSPNDRFERLSQLGALLRLAGRSRSEQLLRPIFLGVWREEPHHPSQLPGNLRRPDLARSIRLIAMCHDTGRLLNFDELIPTTASSGRASRLASASDLDETLYCDVTGVWARVK